MWKLDKNDPLDQAIIRTMQGEIIDFVEWEYLLEQLAEEPDEETQLQALGYTVERGLREGEAYRAEFLALLAKYDLPADNRLRLCFYLLGLALEGVAGEQEDDLLRIYSGLICDDGFLLDQNREDLQGAVSALCYVKSSTEAAKLYDTMKTRISIAERFQTFLVDAQKNSPPKTDCDTSMMHAVFREYQNAFGNAGNDAVFLSNIEYLLQVSAGSEALRTVEPLFLYQAIMCHDKRLHTSDTLRMDMQKLWKYKTYKIDSDNGKNFKANTARLEFFAGLCELYKKDRRTDLPLCWYGFEHLSNLGDFYRAKIDWQNFPDPPTLQLSLPETLDELTEWSPFTCYEDGGDNVILKNDSFLTPNKVEQFRFDPKYQRALNKLEDYIDVNATQLAPRFWDADDETVKALCNEILTKAEIPSRWKPKNLKEISLFLAAINEELLELIEIIMWSLLLKAGEVLLRESP